ncbi:MAG: hypothetical protein JW814_09635 [Candidatus Krumholzibacteriota bacterium]|nr:hypothetical protein [Candidatus Krumholzibacteriota bacterium]
MAVPQQVAMPDINAGISTGGMDIVTTGAGTGLSGNIFQIRCKEGTG